MNEHNLSWLATGAPRSGTGYFWIMMRRLGFLATHERCSVQLEGFTVPPELVGGGETSWMLAPYIHRLKPGAPLIHLVREPLATIASIVRNRFLVRAPEEVRWEYGELARHHLPGLRDEQDPVALAALFWIRWNLMIEQHCCDRPYVRLLVEAIDLPELTALCRLLGHEPTVAQVRHALEVPRNTNTRGPTAEPRCWAEVPEPHRSRARHLAERYGYPHGGAVRGEAS